MSGENKVYGILGGASIWSVVGGAVGSVIGGALGYLRLRNNPGLNQALADGDLPPVAGRIGAIIGAGIGAFAGSVVGMVGGLFRGYTVANKEEKRVAEASSKTAEMQARLETAQEYLNHPAENARSQTGRITSQREAQAANGHQR